MKDITKWRIYFSMVFGGIFFLILSLGFIIDFIPIQVSNGVLAIWLGGIAVSYFSEVNDRNTTKKPHTNNN